VLGHCHHAAIARLYGAAASPDGSLFLAYKLVPDDAPLSALLRGAAHNRGFTPLATWSACLRVAANACDALSYVHLQVGTVHNRLSSSTVLVCGDGARLRAKIAHFGAADLAGELPPSDSDTQSHPTSARHRRTGSRRIEGTRGYMAPEIIAGIREEMEIGIGLDCF
jgi:serine/threonine protein kinase